jgi:hypothetical protein
MAAEITPGLFRFLMVAPSGVFRSSFTQGLNHYPDEVKANIFTQRVLQG